MNSMACQTYHKESKLSLLDETAADFRVYPGIDSPNIKNPGLVLTDSVLDDFNKAGAYHKKL